MSEPIVAPCDPNIDDRDVVRVGTQAAQILRLLQCRPATNLELSGISLKYTGRISDLRAAGYTIKCHREHGGLTTYTLEQ